MESNLIFALGVSVVGITVGNDEEIASLTDEVSRRLGLGLEETLHLLLNLILLLLLG